MLLFHWWEDGLVQYSNYGRGSELEWSGFKSKLCLLLKVRIQASYLTSLPRKIHCDTDGTVVSRCQFWGYIHTATLSRSAERDSTWASLLQHPLLHPHSLGEQKGSQAFTFPPKLPWKRGRETALLKDFKKWIFVQKSYSYKDTEWSRTPWSLPTPPRPTSYACLFSVENFSQRISLIREIRNEETKENSQKRLNNNNVVIKHSQGPLVLSQGL